MKTQINVFRLYYNMNENLLNTHPYIMLCILYTLHMSNKI